MSTNTYNTSTEAYFQYLQYHQKKFMKFPFRGFLPLKNITLKFNFGTKMPILQKVLVAFNHLIRFWKGDLINFIFVKKSLGFRLILGQGPQKHNPLKSIFYHNSINICRRIHCNTSMEAYF